MAVGAGIAVGAVTTTFILTIITILLTTTTIARTYPIGAAIPTGSTMLSTAVVLHMATGPQPESMVAQRAGSPLSGGKTALGATNRSEETGNKLG